MAGPGPDGTLLSRTDGIGLLARAIGYTLGSLRLVSEVSLTRPTPCRGWSLEVLLAHMDDSLLALCEAADLGKVSLVPRGQDDGLLVAPAAVLRARACGLLRAWARAGRREVVSVGNRPIGGGALTAAGAVEVTVHGWDVARSCGHAQPIPAGLAGEVLDAARWVLRDEDRPGRFDPPLALSPGAGPSDQLLAFLGRDPR